MKWLLNKGGNESLVSNLFGCGSRCGLSYFELIGMNIIQLLTLTKVPK